LLLVNGKTLASLQKELRGQASPLRALLNLNWSKYRK
jgi:hypothetical protein